MMTTDDSLRKEEEEELFLRRLIAEKPLNAKAHAKLAGVLMGNISSVNDPADQERLREEAVRLSKRAITVKPDLPWGYGALSTASNNHSESMKSLQKALQLIDAALPNKVFVSKGWYAHALVRLLLEPREEQARQIQRNKRIGKASLKHPYRRSLDPDELELYERIKLALTAAWEEQENTEKCLTSLEYRLGLFFRKKEPTCAYRAISRHHLHQAYLRLPQDSSESESALFWLATLSDYEAKDNEADTVIHRCPQSYVTSLYSSFAERFDTLFAEKLDYKTPAKLRLLVDQTVEKTGMRWSPNSADLGCGTGLSGDAFRDCVEHMVGVDLSPEMIERARLRKCYDSLVVGDMTAVLGGDKKYHLIFSCDTFCYIGDLNTTFAAVRKSLLPGGIFAFSTESLEEDMGGSRQYILQPCARFSHKKSYVEKLLLDEGMTIANHQVCPIRKNAGKKVIGLLVVARLP